MQSGKCVEPTHKRKVKDLINYLGLKEDFDFRSIEEDPEVGKRIDLKMNIYSKPYIHKKLAIFNDIELYKKVNDYRIFLGLDKTFTDEINENISNVIKGIPSLIHESIQLSPIDADKNDFFVRSPLKGVKDIIPNNNTEEINKLEQLRIKQRLKLQQLSKRLDGLSRKILRDIFSNRQPIIYLIVDSDFFESKDANLKLDPIHDKLLDLDYFVPFKGKPLTEKCLTQNQVRYFNSYDKNNAKELADNLSNINSEEFKPIDLSGWKDNNQLEIGTNEFEVWLTSLDNNCSE